MKWIPVSERLPKPEGHERYLVTIAHYNPDYKGHDIAVCEYEARDTNLVPHWVPEQYNEGGVRITAWAPLPKGYKAHISLATKCRIVLNSVKHRIGARRERDMETCKRL